MSSMSLGSIPVYASVLMTRFAGIALAFTMFLSLPSDLDVPSITSATPRRLKGDTNDGIFVAPCVLMSRHRIRVTPA